MQLSLALGVPLTELRGTLPEADFRVYAAYLSEEPDLASRLDWWGAQLLAAAINPHRKPHARAVDPTTLMPRRWGRKPRKKYAAKPKTPQQWRATLAGLTRSLGGTVR